MGIANSTKLLIFVNILLTNIAYGSEPVLFKKSIGSFKKQRVWELVSQEFSDLRYDIDGDGKIDDWTLRQKNLSINLHFKNQKIDKIIYSLKDKSTYIKAFYNFEKDRYILTKVFATAKPVSSMLTAFGRDKSDLCVKENNTDIFKLRDWDTLNQKISALNAQKVWRDAIDPTCAQERNTINTALNEAFYIPEGKKSNSFVDCLSESPQTQPFVTSFLEIALKGPNDEHLKKISCATNEPRDCGTASFTSADSTIHIPISSPNCTADMKKVYKKQIYHETLHSISEYLPERDVAAIVERCDSGHPEKFAARDLDNHMAENTGNTNGHLSKAHKDNLIIEAAQLKVTNIPKSIAEGSLAIPSPEPQTSGMVALNNSFQESRGPASASVTIPLQQSIAMSAPFFKAAAKVFSNYKLEPMQGQAPITTQLASQKTPRAVAAPANAEISKPTTSTSAEPASFAKADNSKPSIAENSEPNASPSVPTTQAQAQTTARSPEVGTSGARGIASAPSTTASTSAAAKPRVSDDASITQERAKVAQNLIKMSIPQAREYIKSNELNLERLKILILSQKNQRWGYKDPSRAAVLIQEVNGQLRIESQ